MKLLQFFVVVLLVVSYSVQAQEEAPPDPTPGATKPVREQNLDDNEWIAVHEQGTANVEVQNDETNPIPVDIQGTVEAEITGGEVEVLNEVTVRMADGEFVTVMEGNRSATRSFWLDHDRGWASSADYHQYTKFTSLVCEATSDYPDINDSLNVRIYVSSYGGNEYDDFEDQLIYDVCAPFTKGYDDGSLAPEYHYYCKSNSEWNIMATNMDTEYVYAVRGGNMNAPVKKIRCMLKGVRYD
jgi:hypothetical protein